MRRPALVAAGISTPTSAVMRMSTTCDALPGKVALARAALCILIVACLAPPAAVAPARVVPSALPLSEPAEYEIPRISRAAGEEIFTRTGIGDPYQTGIPYAVWLAILRAAPEQLGGDPQALAHRFGFLARTPDPTSTDLDKRDGLPIGMHVTTDPRTGAQFLVTSCVLCHAERIGDQLVVGLANKRGRVHAYYHALATADVDPKQIEAFASEAATQHHLAWPVHGGATLVAGFLAGLRGHAQEHAVLDRRTRENPPGRVAPVETIAVTMHRLTNRTIDAAPDVGWAKIPDVIGFGVRTSLTWDGAEQGSMDQQAVLAEIEVGVRDIWLERHPFQAASLGAFLRQPRARPGFPGTLNRALAEQGRSVFADACASCHGTYGVDGRVIDYDDQPRDVGTDPARALAPSATFEAAANDPLLTHGATRFHRTGAYISPVLTNVWARAPYGHAGQWPSLAVMAMAPAERPGESCTH